ncbi:MAG: hypothetical protein NZ529_02850 [Cytophagaceae bacterium]|nr:hypothetical protein [Cytophagaceae bacterium]MDW8455710.1 hypothetical protein [Cytophagaceae bacterium]
MKTCKYKVMACNEAGCIVQCSLCKRIQIAFGTTAVNFSINQYEQFSVHVKNTYLTCEHKGFPDLKMIQVSLNSEHISMVLTYNELSKLVHILTEAEIIMEATEILNDNTSSAYN